MTPDRPDLTGLTDYLAARPEVTALARSVPRGRLYLVGGLIRDCLLGRHPGSDIDLTVAGSALELGREAADRLAARLVVLSERDDTVRLVRPDLSLDLTGFRRPDLTGDLRARDYTVNALAVDLSALAEGNPRLIDPTGGLADLAARRLVPADSDVLTADPLRVLRAYRLAAELGLTIPPATVRAMAAAAPGLRRIAGERLSAELNRLLQTPDSAPWLTAMARDKLLGFVLPEVAALAGQPQNRYHHLNALGHTLAALTALEGLLAEPPDWTTGQELDQPSALALKWAALYHDTGKPACHQPRPWGGTSFPGHNRESARLWNLAAQRLRLPNGLTRLAERLIEAHMRPLQILLADRITAKAVRRMIRAVDGRAVELGLLTLADSLATQGPQRAADFEERLNDLWQQVMDLGRAMDRQELEPLLKGDELMAELGLFSGPLVGRLLDEIAAARLAGEITDRAEALELAARLAKAGKSGGVEGGD